MFGIDNGYQLKMRRAVLKCGHTLLHFFQAFFGALGFGTQRVESLVHRACRAATHGHAASAAHTATTTAHTHTAATTAHTHSAATGHAHSAAHAAARAGASCAVADVRASGAHAIVTGHIRLSRRGKNALLVLVDSIAARAGNADYYLDACGAKNLKGIGPTIAGKNGLNVLICQKLSRLNARASA